MRRRVLCGTPVAEATIAPAELKEMARGRWRPGELPQAIGRRLFPDHDQAGRDAAASVAQRYCYAPLTRNRKDKAITIRLLGTRAEVVADGKVVLT